MLQRIVLSENPSAYGEFPGDILVGRHYDRLVKLEALPDLGEYPLSCPGETQIPELNLKVICKEPSEAANGWLVRTCGGLVLRSRMEGDRITLSGGTTTLKKLFIAKKIPASRRNRVPVIADQEGVVLVAGIGPNRNRLESPNCEIRIESL